VTMAVQSQEPDKVGALAFGHRRGGGSVACRETTGLGAGTDARAGVEPYAGRVTTYRSMRPVRENDRPGWRPTLVVVVVILLVGAGITALVVTRAEAKQAAQGAALTYVERQEGRAGATILDGQLWDDCALYEVGLGQERATVVVVKMNGVWTVARESGKPTFTFDLDSDYTHVDCLAIAS
jgi:hypothetical protein